MSATTDTSPATEPDGPAGPGRAAAPRSRRTVRRRPVKRATIWTHRWLSLVLGLFLLVECTTGALLVYGTEINRQLRADDYAQGDLSGVHPDFDAASEAAEASQDGFRPSYLYTDGGTVLVNDAAGDVVTVDPRDDTVVGGWAADEHAPGWIGWTMAAAENVHLCALTCPEDPLYVEVLTKEVPHSGWAGFSYDGETYPVTWGGLVLAVLAILLLFLALSGIWLWWPGRRHFKRGVRVRLRGNRYARDYDLHQVVGMIAIPLLLLWAVTGLSYESGLVAKGYYAALPGSEQEAPVLTSATEDGPDIGYDAAVAAAQAKAGTDSAPVYYSPPAGKRGAYDIWFSDGFDPWAGADSGAGDLEVYVDRHDAGRTAFAYGDPGSALSQRLYSDWNYPLHAGTAFNGWWRIIWLVLGLTPLLLAWTGVSTWLFKRAVKKRRRRAERERAAAREGAGAPA